MADDHLAKKHHCPRKKPKLGRKEEFGKINRIWQMEKIGRKGKNWENWIKLEEWGKDEKNWQNCKNLEFRLC